MQEDPLPEQIEIPYTALGGIVPQRTGPLAPGAQGDDVPMSAKQVQHLLPSDLFRHITDQFKFGQVQPLIQCRRADRLNDLPSYPFDGVPGVFEMFDRRREKE